MKNAMTLENAAAVPVTRPFLDGVALTIATCGGIGYAPVVPATFGSLAAVGIYLAAQQVNGSLTVWTVENYFSNALLESSRGSFILVFLIGLFLIGMWSATRTEKITGIKDGRIVVVDEVVGQLITFWLVPAAFGWWTVPVGFVVFRFFDIWKPFPADKLESLPTGLGVMADDVMAGVYAAALLSILCSVYLAVF